MTHTQLQYLSQVKKTIGDSEVRNLHQCADEFCPIEGEVYHKGLKTWVAANWDENGKHKSFRHLDLDLSNIKADVPAI